MCDALAAKLATELAEAQKCEPGGGDPLPECRTWVPTTTGCEAPVNNDESSATADYIRTWNEYAAVCPVLHPPCVDPELLATACVPSATPGSTGVSKLGPGHNGPTASNSRRRMDDQRRARWALRSSPFVSSRSTGRRRSNTIRCIGG